MIWSHFIAELFSRGGLCIVMSNGILELKKRLPDLVVTVVFPSTWEIVPQNLCLAGLPPQDLEIYLISSPCTWSTCPMFLESSVMCEPGKNKVSSNQSHPMEGDQDVQCPH